MCGIYGVLHPRSDAMEVVRAMGAYLSHRGPDGSGIEVTPAGVLGHRRLSIIDLTPAASQPLWDVERRACVSYNGELYNFPELREECRRAGFEFRSASDTEVLVNAYLLHGPAVFDRLNGIFAFCLYDARTGDVFLVRDPMGVKPLYYADTPDGLFFASELGALLRSGAVAPDVDQEALQAYLQLDFVPSPLSIVKGARKLEGGHALHVAASGVPAISRYTTLDAGTVRRSGSLEDDVRTFDVLIHRAVESQLVSDVPLGVFLSGGLDSSIVAQAASDVCRGRLSTFSIGFDDPSFDESRYFSAVARHLGTEHHVETLGARAMLDLIPSIAEVSSEPLADGSILPTLLLSRFARRSVTVALSGDGADELFAGYPTYLAARLARALVRLPAPARRALSSLADRLLPVSVANLSFDFRVKKLLAGLDPDPVLQNARWLGTFRKEELPELLREHDPSAQRGLEELLHRPASPLPESMALERLLRTDQRFYLSDGVLQKVDRASMSTGLEVRVPFLDHDLVRFARSLPADRKLPGRRGKLLLKRYAAGRLPEAVLARRKKGFGAPLARWFRGELRDFVNDTLSPERVTRQGLFRPAFVERLLLDHASGRRDQRKQIFNLLVFTLWHEAFVATVWRKAA